MGIKVGVVNNDKGGTLRGVTFNIGDEIVHSLQQNEKLGWTFYNTKDEGVAKAENGEVYATIVIPDDFSLKMSTMLSARWIVEAPASVIFAAMAFSFSFT